MKLWRLTLWIAALLLASLPLQAADEATSTGATDRYSADQGFVVHEWGVISVGCTQAQRNDLPDFVRQLSARRQSEEKCIDKPVVYFYAPATLQVGMTIRARACDPFCWWPEAESVSTVDTKPSATDADDARDKGADKKAMKAADELSRLQDTLFSWPAIDIRPGAEMKFPAVAAGHWFEAARAVQACPIRVNDQNERFILWEANGGATPLLKIHAMPGDAGGHAVTLMAPETAHDVWIVGRQGDAAFLHKIGSLQAGATSPSVVVDLAAQPGFTAACVDAMESSLRAAGLYRDEAASVAAIWKTAWFETDGLRVIYRLDPAAIERDYPMTLTVEPATQTRVMLVCQELHPELERSR